MTKRIIALFLVCILAVPLLAMPASALSSNPDYSDWENQIIYEVQKIDIWLEDWLEAKIEEIRQTVNSIGFAMDEIIAPLKEIAFDVDSMFYNWSIKFANLDSISTYLSTMSSDIWGYFESVLNSVKNTLGQVEIRLISIDSYLQTLYYDFWDLISGFKDTIVSSITEVKDTIVTWFTSLIESITGFRTSMETWFDQTYWAIVNLISSLAEHDDEEFKEQVATDATEFDESMDIIQDSTRPVIEDIELGVSDHVSSSAVYSYNLFFQEVFAISPIYSIFFLSFLLSLISYVIFGKR